MRTKIKTIIFSLVTFICTATSCTGNTPDDQLIVSVDPGLDLKRIRIETAMYPLEDVKMRKESSVCLDEIVFDGKDPKDIPGNYRVIDFFITYDNKNYYQFTHAKLDEGKIKYDFKLSFENDKIALTVSIQGPFSKDFKRNLIELKEIDRSSINRKEYLNPINLSSLPVPQLPIVLEPFDLDVLGKSTGHTFVRQIGVNTHIRKAESYTVVDNLGYGIKQYFLRIAGDGKIRGYEYTINPVFFTSKVFTPAGQPEQVGIECWFGFKMGKWKTYTYDGKLISSIDYDIGYSYDFRKLFKFCNDNDISLKKVKGGIKKRTYIKKDKNPQYGYIWIIEYFKGNDNHSSIIELSGNTGRIINRKPGSIKLN